MSAEGAKQPAVCGDCDGKGYIFPVDSDGTKMTLRCQMCDGSGAAAADSEQPRQHAGPRSTPAHGSASLVWQQDGPTVSGVWWVGWLANDGEGPWKVFAVEVQVDAEPDSEDPEHGLRIWAPGMDGLTRLKWFQRWGSWWAGPALRPQPVTPNGKLSQPAGGEDVN